MTENIKKRWLKFDLKYMQEPETEELLSEKVAYMHRWTWPKDLKWLQSARLRYK